MLIGIMGKKRMEYDAWSKESEQARCASRTEGLVYPMAFAHLRHWAVGRAAPQGLEGARGACKVATPFGAGYSEEIGGRLSVPTAIVKALCTSPANWIRSGFA
jgi:hypothetical protein